MIGTDYELESGKSVLSARLDEDDDDDDDIYDVLTKCFEIWTAHTYWTFVAVLSNTFCEPVWINA